MSLERQPRIRPVEFRYGDGHSTGEHTHDEHQVVYAADGVLSVETQGFHWVLPTQRLAWIPAGATHTVFAESEAAMAALYIEESGPPAIADVGVFDVSPLLRQLILHVLVDGSTGEERRRLERVLLDQLAAAPETPSRLPRVHDPRLRDIARHLHADPSDTRTLRDFGRVVGASERTLQRLFVAETGTTFGRWRTLLRLQHALIWLGRGETVTVAAIRSGYHQPSAFIAAFRSVFGTTPARFVRSGASMHGAASPGGHRGTER